MAVALGVIALAKDTGWSEEFIRERLPLARFLVYRHAQLWIRGAWTIPPGESLEAQLEILGL